MIAEPAESPLPATFSRRVTALTVIAILALAVVLRLPGYSESIWIDELYTSNLFCGDPVILLKTLYSDIHPPAYFVFIHFWNGIFGDAEVWLRLPPLLFGLGSILLVWRLGTLFVGQGTGLVAALMLATSPVHIWFSQEARPYSANIFLLLLATLAFYRLIEKKRGATWTLVYFLALFGIAFTHYYTAAYAVVFSVLAILHKSPSRRRILVVNAVVLFLVTVYLGAKMYFSDILTEKSYLGPFGLVQAWKLGFEWFLTGNSLVPVDGGTEPGKAALIGIQVLAVAALVRGAWRLSREACPTPGARGYDLLLLMLVLPVSLFVLTLIGMDKSYIERSAVPALPLFLLVLATGATGFRGEGSARAALATAVAAGAVVLAAFLSRGDSWTVYKPNPDWRSAAALLGAELDDSEPLRRLYSDYVSPTGLTYYDARIQEIKNFDVNQSKEQKLLETTTRVFGSEGFPGAQIQGLLSRRLTDFRDLMQRTESGMRLAVYELARHDPLATVHDEVPAREFWLLIHSTGSSRAADLLADARIEQLEQHSFRELRLYRLRRRAK